MVTLSVSTECKAGLHDKCPKLTIAHGGGIGDGWSCFCECHFKKDEPPPTTGGASKNDEDS